MSPLDIAFGIAFIGVLVYFVAKRNKEVEVAAPVAEYKVEPPVVVKTPEVAPALAPVVAEATAKKPRAKKAPAEKPATTTKSAKATTKPAKTAPAKQPTTKAKTTTKTVAKKARIRVVK